MYIHIHTHIWLPLLPPTTTMRATGTWVRPQSKADPECDATTVTVAASSRRCFRLKTTHPRRCRCRRRRRRRRQQRRWQWQKRWRWQRLQPQVAQLNVAKSSCYCSVLLVLHANRSATSRLCIINSYISINPLFCSYRNCQRHLQA